MNKKVVMFTSVILFLGLLSVNGLATGHSKDNFFEYGTGDHEFVWHIHSDYNVSKNGVIVTTPEAIVVNKTIVDNKKDVTIHLEGNDLSEGVYTITTTLRNFQRNKISTFNVPIIVGMATNGQVDSLSDDIDDLDERISDINTDLENDISDINDEIDKAKSDIEDLQDELSNVKSSGSERKSELNTLDNNLSQLTAKLGNLKSDLNEAESKLKKVKSTTSTGMVFTSASLGIGILVLVILVLYLGLKKGFFKRILQASQQTYKEKVQKKEPWER